MQGICVFSIFFEGLWIFSKRCKNAWKTPKIQFISDMKRPILSWFFPFSSLFLILKIPETALFYEKRIIFDEIGIFISFSRIGKTRHIFKINGGFPEIEAGKDLNVPISAKNKKCRFHRNFYPPLFKKRRFHRNFPDFFIFFRFFLCSPFFVVIFAEKLSGFGIRFLKIHRFESRI